MIGPILALWGLTLLGCADPGRGDTCRTEQDCPPGRACFDGRCDPPPPCALDTDCPARQICRDRRCAAQSCLTDDDCPERRCVDRWCRPRASTICADDGHCPAGACDPTIGLCVLDTCPASGCAAGCALDPDCPPGAWCAADGVCRSGCRVGGCGAGLCDPETRRCGAVGCAGDADCPPGAWCDGGLCAPGCRLDPDDCPGGRCDRTTRRCGCGVDRDCAEDMFCADDGVCRPGCRVGGCPDEACDPVSRRCGAVSCARDVDCPPGQACGVDDPTCAPARGPLPVEAACAMPDQCATGVCEAGRCVGRCAADADCPSGRCALRGAALVCAPPPAPCAVDADCPGACLPARVVRVDDRGSPEPEDDRPVGFAGCLDPALGSGARCAADAECAPGEACGLWPDAAVAAFEPRCRRVAGAGLGGDGCAADADCRGRWCAEGVCVAPCIGDADPGCAADAPCVPAAPIVWGRTTAPARVCGVPSGGEAR